MSGLFSKISGFVPERDREHLHNTIRIVRVLAFVTIAFALVCGSILYQMSADSAILIAAAIEASLCVAVLLLIAYGKFDGAILLTFFIHCASTLYFGLKFTEKIPIDVMGIFLGGIACLLFDIKIYKWAAFIAIASALLILELNYWKQFVAPHALSIYNEKLIRFMAVVAVFVLNYLMLYYRERQNTMWKHKATRNKKAIVAHVLEAFHQTRNDLHAIFGIVQCAIDSTGDLQDDQEITIPVGHLRAMYNACKAMKDQSDNYIEWGRFEEGHHPPITMEGLDLPLWLDNISGRYRLQASNKPVKLVLVADNAIPRYVMQDRNRLEAIVGNLLTNAIKFTPKNTTVVLNAAVDNNTLVFSVTDQGKGMDEKRQAAVFQPFETESNSFIQGSGVGLTVARDLARAMKGDVSVKSEPGKGATFIVTLPLEVAPEPESIVVPASEISLDGYTALVVDDELMSRRVAFLNLRNRGLNVLTSDTAEDAMKKLAQQKIDIVVLDSKLSQHSSSGLDVLRWIKADPKLKHIPVIMATGDAFRGEDGDIRLLSAQAGASEFITKPLDFKELTLMIHTLLDRTGIAAG